MERMGGVSDARVEEGEPFIHATVVLILVLYVTRRFFLSKGPGIQGGPCA